MTATHGRGTYGNGVGTVTPYDDKMGMIGEVAKSAANVIRPGIFWDGNTTIVSGKANMSYDVRAFSAALSRGATAGAVKLANDATYNVATTAAPGSNSRYDVVYLWQREYQLDGTDSEPVIGVVQGTAAASPTVPSLSAYPGAIELARILVPAGVTATNSGTTITQTGKFTASAGGVIAFRSTTERDEDTYQEGQLGWLIDTNTPIVYNGSAWLTVSTRKVTTGSFTAASSVSVESVFEAGYSYRVTYVVTAASGASTQTMQLLAGSSANTAANYTRQSLLSTSTTVTSSSSINATDWLVSASTARPLRKITVDFVNPNEATPTFGTLTGFERDSGRTAVGNLYVELEHSASTAFDGFKLTCSTGTMTGTYRVERIG